MLSGSTRLQRLVRPAAGPKRPYTLASRHIHVPKFSVDDAVKIMSTTTDPKVLEIAVRYIVSQKDLELAQKDKELAQKDKELAEYKIKTLKAQLLREQGRLSARGFIEYMQEKVVPNKGSRLKTWQAYFAANPSLLESGKKLLVDLDAAVAAAAVTAAYGALSTDIHAAKYLELLQQSGDVVLLGPPLSAMQAQLLRLVAEANDVPVQVYGFARAKE